jgi:hypothetical protein
VDNTKGRTGGIPLKDHCKMNNYQSAIGIKNLYVIANYSLFGNYLVKSLPTSPAYRQAGFSKGRREVSPF